MTQTKEENKSWVERFRDRFVKKPVDWRENGSWTVPYVDSQAENVEEFFQSELSVLNPPHPPMRNRTKLMIKEVDTYLTHWLMDFSNKPIKERKNAYEEVQKIRKELLGRIKKI